MTTVSIHMPENTGLTGFTLYLRKTSDGTLVNTGGDALTESPASSGRFTATVAESWTETLAAVVLDSNSLAVRDGWLAVGETIVRDGYPGLTTEQEQTITAISAALAGAPVEPTGRIASGGGIVAYIGDDFRVRSGTQLQIPVSDPSGGLYTKLNAIGAANLAFGASRPDKAAGVISGTIASLATSGSGASQLLLITVEISNCGSGLRPGDDYTYQIEDRQTQGTEVDSFVRIEGSMELRKKVV